MIKIDNLTKKFGSKTAIDGVSFTVPDGKVVGFLGPNGAGKSTTMRCALGLNTPNKGETLIDGEKYQNLSKPLESVGAMLDAKAFHKARSPRGHLRIIAAANNISSKRVDEVLDIAGLASVANKKAGGFSLGMAQRIGIAAALLGSPKNLVLDEPVNGLDPEGVKWVREMCKKHAEGGGSVLISSHLMSEVAQTADDLVVIGKGKILNQGSVSEIINMTSLDEVRIVAEDPEKLSKVLKDAGIEFSTSEVDGKVQIIAKNSTPEKLAPLIAENQIVTYELSAVKNTLEESYMQLTHDSVEYESRL